MKQSSSETESIDIKILNLLEVMSLEEKIGQLSLISSDASAIADQTREDLRNGRVGGILNAVNLDTINELQRIAVEESNLGVPLLFGRDVIHGFRTIFPIPLGLAASWEPEIVEQCGRSSAEEAAASGINWTYAPMVDISRDPRWGRVAESFGEDTCLTSQLAVAMVRGFQGADLSLPGSIAACVKHFAGYGASESGKDYNTTNIPENELRNVHLPPFKAAIDAGVASIMTSFSDIDGVPASANQFLLESILRFEWRFDGLVVSDWESIRQLAIHGLTGDAKESAYEAANAGVDMEMTSTTYADHLAQLLDEGRLSIEKIDKMVANILRVKFRLGLFENPYTEKKSTGNSQDINRAVKEAALQSCVLLKNRNDTLPIKYRELNSIAVIGPLADEPAEQLGTWVFDGDASLSRTPLQALQESLSGSMTIKYVRGLETTRSKSRESFGDAVKVAEESDVVVMFLGEEAILAGESHCRADIRLPGVQEELIDAVSRTGKPLVLVLITGRPLALENVVDKIDAILCAWHPGTLGGPAIADLLLGIESPSGKLPITFPRVTGQIPIYYSHKNTGRPATPESVLRMDEIEVGTTQHSFGNTSFYLDTPNTPLFPFGHGLSYTRFEYSNLELSKDRIELGSGFKVAVEVANVGSFAASETVQLYTRDLAGSVTRPVKELKKFKKIRLAPGEKRTVTFEVSTNDLAFYGRNGRLICEPGEFHLWVGGSSEAELVAEFEIV